jgi:multisubunit Na+/H+ antiporter MnhE subunit
MSEQDPERTVNRLGRPGVDRTADDEDEGQDGRRETYIERMDRNWDELLQELRVSQTGSQILTGFLLTIPFQQRFGDLDAYQTDLYLVLVVLAVLSTALMVAPVAVHRVLFRKQMKPALVDAGNVLARVGLGVLGLTLAGSGSFVFDVVVDRTAGYVVGAIALAVLLFCWWLLPLVLVQRARSDD